MTTKGTDSSLIRKLYKDLLLGYSKVYGKDVYVKHFKEIDIGYLNEIKEDARKEATSKGLNTEEQQIKVLIEQDLWDKELEEKIPVLEAQIANQEQTKTKLIIKSQIDQINKRINTLEAELGEIYDKRNKIVGLSRIAKN